MYTYTTLTGRYLVEVHGNGWAYAVTDQETNESLWFQDQDADTTRERTNDFEDEDSIAQYFECID